MVTYLYVGDIFVNPLALSMPTYSNFQINGATGETFLLRIATFIINMFHTLKYATHSQPC